MSLRRAILAGTTAALVAWAAGCSSDAPFKSMADHSRSAADTTFSDFAVRSPVQSGKDMFFLNMKSVDVIQEAIVSFSDDG